MDIEQVKDLLNEHDIIDIEGLKIFLENNSVVYEPMEPDEKEYCKKAKYFDSDEGIPHCRRIREIYAKYFKEEYPVVTKFIKYVSDSTGKSFSRVDQYTYCKQCDYEEKKAIVIKADFLISFCNDLSKKFDYETLFKKNHRSVDKFIKEIKPISKDYLPLGNGLTESEKHKLFDVTSGSRFDLKNKLKNPENLDGSDLYRMKLAEYVFDRNLNEESLSILQLLSNSEKFKYDTKYLQLKAKLLSKNDNNKEAIATLEKLISLEINTESHNLLAASIKREAVRKYMVDKDKRSLKDSLEKSRAIYYSTYRIEKDFYPAINIIYIDMILAHIDDEKDLQTTREQSSCFWNDIKLDKEDWYSFISDVEFLILMGKYDDARKKLNVYKESLHEEEISDFDVSATRRQCEIYYEFCKEKELKYIITYLKNIQNNKEELPYNPNEES